MKHKFVYLILCLVFFQLTSMAQPKSYIQHYGAEDGLPQNTVMDILQDKKGIMWFSTWDGLCKFDGYRFTAYQNMQNNPYPMRSNRIDHILEDKQGYIWTLSYDNEAHRFDPRTETFMGIRSLDGYDKFSFLCSNMQVMPSGKVWLMSKGNGCISVSGSQFDIQIYNKEKNKLKCDTINFIYEDDELNSWLLTKNGLYTFSPDNELIYPFTNLDNNQPFYTAAQINNEVWLGSDNGNIWIFNKKSQQFRLFDIHLDKNINEIKPIDDTNILITTNSPYFFIYNIQQSSIKKFDITLGLANKNETIVKSYIDKSQRIWFELNRLGASLFLPEKETIHHFSRSIESPIVNVTAPKFIILEDENNNTWVHPKGGGFSLYDAKENKLVPFHNEPNSLDWKFSSMLHSAFFDKQNNLWLGTHSNGLDKVIFSNEVFRPEMIDKQAKNQMNNLVRCIFEDNGNNLWVSTKDGKVHVYNRNHEYLGYLCTNGAIGYGNPIAGITYCMMQDKNNDIWLGTKGKGIYKLKATSNKIFSIKHYQHDPANPYSLSSDNIYSIFEDSKDKVWIGSYGGGLNLMEEDNKFINRNNLLINYPIDHGSQVRIINADKFGNICVGTTLGLIMFSNQFDLYNNIDFKYYVKQAGSEPSLTANDIFDIITTQKGETYLATFGGGINKIAETDTKGFPTKFSSFTTANGLSSNIALQIAEDYEGKLWISSEGNISILNPLNNEIKSHNEIYKIIKGHSFTEGAKCVSHTGMIHFGYSNGLLTINSNIIKSNLFKPYLALTNLQIANKNVGYGANSPLQINIDDTKELILTHDQTSFNIEYAAIDYTETNQILYSHLLEGFDKEWITTQDQRVATYNNLSPGKYIFRVRSTNSDGIWMDNEHTLPIEIVPSFWQTNWAILLYFIIIATTLAIIFRSLFIYYRLKDKMSLEQDEIEMKTRFFMDISHEIRTPLTMVVSPIENILEGEHSKEDVKSQLNLVLKNANRMLRMVNQILDFRKIEKSKLNIQNTLIGSYIEDICKNFSKTAEIQNISLKVTNEVPDSKLWIDRDNVEKLLFNLLSNAFKHTSAGKSIGVNIYKKGNTIALEVKDEGKGMTKEVQGRLFTRFASFSSDKSKPSTGIGLSIVKEIADKHKAKIEVTSEDAKGSTFSIYFQTGHSHFDEELIELVTDDELITEKQHQQKIEVESENETRPIIFDNEEIADNKPTILVVEDDTDLRGYIVKVLEKDYNILEAENGEQGYEIALRELPDFILSDIMMPKVDGVEFLQNIKKNATTSHIPFILLTAKVNMESRLEGLRYGADDYITKPFSVKYLKARILNIIEQRRIIYQSFLSEETSPLVEDTHEVEVITTEDKTFIKTVKEIIEKNIDNSEFVVEDLTTEMLMSRTVFFKKMKSLTGLAPIEFIREVKIKYAAQMIVSKDYTIKEISFMIGISDTKYFTKWFKAIMGMTPSEYREKNKPS